MGSAYSGVKRLARENPSWLPVVKACLVEARETGEFAGAWALQRAQTWKPGLSILVRYGILEHRDTTRGGRRAYYSMPDIEGVALALRELGAD